nr:retrovirus-related Pol polyprotein from transposon TNT 1-94 [Tanacetum cinerariifolium]
MEWNLVIPLDSSFELTGFSDADYAGCKDTFNSTSGGAQFSGEKLVSWSSNKQDCKALSIAKAKYVSLSTCCAQVLGMQTQLTDYGFHFNKIPIYCDSKSAIAISRNPFQHSRTKHIAVRYHFIKEHVEKGKLALPLYYLGFITRHNRGVLSWYDLSATYHSKDSGPSQGLYLCQIVLRYRCTRTELITPDLTCPSTHQLLQSCGGDSGPDLSFNNPASPKRLFSLARVSLAEASKLDLSFGCFGETIPHQEATGHGFSGEIWEEELWDSCSCKRCVEISERLRHRNELVKEIRSLKNRLLAVGAVSYYRVILAQEIDKLEHF